MQMSCSMFTSSLTEEVRSLNTYIEHVSAKIDSPVLCEKVRLFVYAPREIQEMYRVDARLKHTHILKAVLMGPEQPVLSRSLAVRVDRAWMKWAAWMDERQRQGRGKRDESDSEEGPTDEEAWLFEDLRVLINLHLRLRDREQLIALIFEVRVVASRLVSRSLTHLIHRVSRRSCSRTSSLSFTRRSPKYTEQQASRNR